MNKTQSAQGAVRTRRSEGSEVKILHVIFAFSIFVGIFLVVWGLTFVFHNTAAKLVSWLIWGLSGLILALSLFWMVSDFVFQHQTQAFGKSLLGMSNGLGIFAWLWGLAALFILFSKYLFHRLHSRRANDGDVVRRILLLAKKHHNLFGWVTLVAAGAHGAYFLFHQPNRWSEVYSGIGAWTALVLLALSGMWMRASVRNSRQVKLSRVSHIALTLGYVGALFLHFPGSLVLGVLLFAAAFIAMGLVWVVVRVTDRVKKQVIHD